MDWNEDIGTNLWIFSKGMKRNGMVGPNSFEWTIQIRKCYSIRL